MSNAPAVFCVFAMALQTYPSCTTHVRSYLLLCCAWCQIPPCLSTVERARPIIYVPIYLSAYIYTSQVLLVGGLFPLFLPERKLFGAGMAAAAQLAIKQINNKTDGVFDNLLPHHEVRVCCRWSFVVDDTSCFANRDSGIMGSKQRRFSLCIHFGRPRTDEAPGKEHRADSNSSH